MFDKVIKIPSKTEMRYQYFCNKCYFYFYGESIGSNFCPNCGTLLKWYTLKQNNNFNDFAQFGQNLYKEALGNV